MAVIKIPIEDLLSGHLPPGRHTTGASCWTVFKNVEINLQQLNPSHPPVAIKVAMKIDGLEVRRTGILNFTLNRI